MDKKFCYMPVLRTRAAELKAYEHVSDSLAREMLPVFELTRARRSKNDGEGDIRKNIERIKSLVGERWFGLDLTVTQQLSNRTIDDILLDGSNAFVKWVQLVKEFESNHIIPAIHIDLDALEKLREEVDELRKQVPYLLLRISIKDYPTEDLKDFFEHISSGKDVLVILDRGFIDIRDNGARREDLESFEDICNEFGPKVHSISYSSSSFPSSVVKPGYGKDAYGFFTLPETIFYEEFLKVTGSVQTCYSDYATVHPLFYPGGGGGWVPRIDVPSGTDLFYHRYRRDNGGYVSAAREVVRDKMFVDHDDWGCNEIKAAASGNPNGRSPAHWISVRMCLHMSRQVERLSNRDNYFEL